MKKIALLLYTVIVLVLAASCDRRAEYLKEVDIERYRAIIKTLNLRK